MKKLKVAVLLILSSIILLPSCKKGESDPFLSLKSRKARLVGEWNLTDGEINNTYGSGFSSNQIYNGSTVIYSQGGSSNSYPYTFSIVFDKDGTYEISEINAGDFYNEKGAWAFGRKNKDQDLKSKETVLLSANYINDAGDLQTFSGTNAINYPSVLLLDMLSSNKLTVTIDGSQTFMSGSSTVSTEKGFLSFEKK